MKQTLSTITQVLDIVRARRRTLKLTQSQLAEKLGVTQTYVSDLENGRRSMSAERLLALLNVLNLELIAQDRTATDKTQW
jgi:HTH-type transcriptional regulator / antitoxin HipB